MASLIDARKKIDNMERVKVYVSRNEGDWEDKGTGRISFEFLPKANRVGVIVVSERSTESLLIHAIGTGSEYCIQDDSKIIKWTESQPEDSIALSFEDENFCKKCFEELQQILQKNEKRSQSELNLEDESKTELPDLTIGTLESVTKMFEDLQPFVREQLFASVRTSNLISELVEVFQQCEDLEDITGCENCCRIARSLVLHADPTMAELLFSEEFALPMIGALEYDPDSPVRIKHRQFLKEQVRFKEVVPISDEDIIRRIHQIYRMQYVKDVVLPRLLDETVFTGLSHVILMNQIDVVASLSIQPTFFRELLHLIEDKETNSQEWKHLVDFLQDYCILIRQLQPIQQRGVFMKLHKLGLFTVLTEVLREGNSESKLKAIDILNSSLIHDPSSLRAHICNTEKHSLFQLLIENLIYGDALGLTEHTLEVVKQFLEPSEDRMNKFTTFLEVFYTDFVPQLVNALSLASSQDHQQQSAVSSQAKGAILDLLSFCVQTHAFNIKYCVVKGNVISQVLSLLKSPERWLVISVIRFIRTMLGMKDDFFDRMISRNNMLTHIINLLVENGDRNNLLNSTILELFDFLRKEKRHMHINYVITQHYDQIKEIDYVMTFQGLKLEYDKSHEEPEEVPVDDQSKPSGQLTRMKRDSRALEKEEEDYFAEGSDDNEKVLESMVVSTNPSSSSILESLQREDPETTSLQESSSHPSESPRTKRLKGTLSNPSQT